MKRIARIIAATLLVGTALFATRNASAAQLTLEWVDNAGGTAHFTIERKTGTTGTYARIGTTATGVTTYADATVAAGTTYCYRVTASSGAGDSGYSNEACGSLATGFVVTVATTGSGSVVSAPAGITCPGTCTKSYATGTVLTLTATPATGSSFSSWSGGGCAGTAPCVLTGNTPATVTATFALKSTASTLSSISPTTAIAGGAAFTLTATGTNFASNSMVQVNGSPRATTFVNATQLTATLPAGDIASPGTASITVFTPGPSGGTSGGQTLTVTGPSLTLSSATVPPGGTVTVTLTNGFGGSTDWIASTAASNPDTPGHFAIWTYVGSGVTTRTWTVTMPTTPGQYEFRFFPNNGYVRAATSPRVTIAGAAPTPSLTVSATTALPGGSVTATLTNGLGGNTDWLSLAPVGAPSTSYLQWVYAGAGVTTRTWTINMPTKPGQYEFRFFPDNGYVLTATSPAITVGK